MNFSHDYLNDAATEIDAAMFSGDAFYDEENWEALQYYLNRWQRGLKNWKEILKQDELSEDGDND